MHVTNEDLGSGSGIGQGLGMLLKRRLGFRLDSKQSRGRELRIRVRTTEDHFGLPNPQTKERSPFRSYDIYKLILVLRRERLLQL